MNVQRAKKQKIPKIRRDHALHLLKNMIRIRRLEEACAELNSAMKIRRYLADRLG